MSVAVAYPSLSLQAEDGEKSKTRRPPSPSPEDVSERGDPDLSRYKPAPSKEYSEPKKPTTKSNIERLRPNHSEKDMYHPSAGPAPNDDDDGADSDDSSVPDPGEIAERERVEATGLWHALPARNTVKAPPKAIAEHHSFVGGHHIRKVWTSGDNKDVHERITACNRQIRVINEERNASETEFYLDGEGVVTEILQARGFIDGWQRARSKQQVAKRTENANNLAVSSLKILRLLGDAGMSWKTIVPPSTQQVLVTVLRDAKLDQFLAERLLRYISESYDSPTPQQENLAQQAEESLVNVFDEAGKGDFDMAEASQKEIASVNKQLIKSNNDAGFGKKDNLLPTKQLTDFITRLRHLEEVQPNDPSRMAIAQTSKASYAKDLLESGYRNLALSLATEEQIKALDTGVSVKPHLSEFFDLSSPHQNAPAGLKSYTVDGPIYSATGITPSGQIVTAQSVGYGTRVLVNIGTKNFPVHRFIPGSVLGRGLAQQYAQDEKFQVKTPKKIRERKAKNLLKILEVCQVESSNRTRQPVTKLLTEWRDGTPGVAPNSGPEWMTRSELIAACGHAWLKQHFENMVQAWQANIAVLDTSKEQGLNPETGEKLAESDRETMPWLFKSTVDDQAAPRRDSARRGHSTMSVGEDIFQIRRLPRVQREEEPQTDITTPIVDSDEEML